MSLVIVLLLIISIVAGLGVFFARTDRQLSLLAVTGSAVIFVGTLSVALPVLWGLYDIQVGMWFVDSLGAFLMVLIGGIQFSATLVSVPYLRAERAEQEISFRQCQWYYALVPLFTFSMLLTVVANNIGLMWVALEGTTLATTMLVAFYTKEGSLEAAWKYILVCSAGISLGLIGVLLMYYGAASHEAVQSAVTWTGLAAVAGTLPAPIIKLAFVFIFIGYGAKVGLVPLHTWLPDAHGRTPSPVSGMLSGVLLNVALFAIIRAKSITDAAIGSADWTNNFCIIFGSITVIVPVAFMVVQKNYKRLLAYSSIEHMGLMVFALGLGAPGAVVIVVHTVGHALSKSALFFGTGNILNAYKSTKFGSVSAVAKYLPITGTLFLLIMFMLLAVPPSPLFFSEFRLVTAALVSHRAATLGLLAALVVVAGAFVSHFIPMFFEERPDAIPRHPISERWNRTHAVMAAHLGLIVFVGVFVFTPAGAALVARIAGAF